MNPEPRLSADASSKVASSPSKTAEAGGSAGAIGRPPGGAAVATAPPLPPGGIPPPGVVTAVPPPRPDTLPPSGPSPRVAPEADAGAVRSSRSFTGPGFVRLAKFSIAAIVVLVGGLVFMQQAFPVLKELVKPERHPPAAAAAEASAGVQMVRQTRAVVEKNNNNAAYLNAIIENKESAPVAKAAPPTAPLAAKPKAPEVRANLKAANRFIEELPINGVTGGDTPRILVNGLLVNVDDVVDWRLGLVFAGLDENARMILFRHKDGALLRRKY